MLIDILEDYKETEDKKRKEELIQQFLNMLWESSCNLRKRKKYFNYKVNEHKLNNRQDLIDLFNEYNNIEMTFCKSFYRKNLNYIDYIRIHVNNMFGFLVDENLYLPKEYYQYLLEPKNQYYKTIKMLDNGIKVKPEHIRSNILSALNDADIIKKRHQKNKVDISWREYKKLIEKYIERLFENYTPPHEYEMEHGWEMKVDTDGWSENNYIIRYFCKSLTGYLKTYRKNILHPPKQKKCVGCNKDLIAKSNRQKYCSDCKDGYLRDSWKKASKKYRDSQPS